MLSAMKYIFMTNKMKQATKPTNPKPSKLNKYHISTKTLSSQLWDQTRFLSFMQLDLDNFQGWKPQGLSGKPVLLLDCPHRENILLQLILINFILTCFSRCLYLRKIHKVATKSVDPDFFSSKTSFSWYITVAIPLHDLLSSSKCLQHN